MIIGFDFSLLGFEALGLSGLFIFLQTNSLPEKVVKYGSIVK